MKSVIISAIVLIPILVYMYYIISKAYKNTRAGKCSCSSMSNGCDGCKFGRN